MIGWFVSLVFAGMVVVRPEFALHALSGWGLVLFCVVWRGRLESAGMPYAWALLLSLLLAWELIVPILRMPQAAPSAWLGGVGCFLLSYLMIWTLSAQDSDLRLQALATAALLLSALIFAKPIVLISALFLSGVLMVHCRRIYGGTIESAFLIFTPTVLCLLTLMLLHNLAPDLVDNPLAQLGEVRLLNTSLTPFSSTTKMEVLPGLGFLFAVLSYRVFEKRVGIEDLAYSGLLLLMILGIAQRSAESTAIDIRMAAYGGGMCLVANAPPRRRACLFALILPLCSAVLRELK